MRLRGVVKGQTILLDTTAGLSEGQQVELEVRPVGEAVEPPASRENTPWRFRDSGEHSLELRIATEPQFENVRRVDRLREKIAEELGSEINLSVRYVREDRDR